MCKDIIYSPILFDYFYHSKGGVFESEGEGNEGVFANTHSSMFIRKQTRSDFIIQIYYMLIKKCIVRNLNTQFYLVE